MIGYDQERADRFVRDALERVQSLPGVEAAALASRAPLDLSFSPQNVLVPGLHGPADRGTPVDTAGVSAYYFDTLGVPLLQGRTFTTADTPDSPRVAIVSHAMALRFWPEGTAVGRRFRLAEWDGVEYEVVGVSSDYKVRFPTEEPASYLHLAASQRLRTGAVILARTRGDAAALSADIRRELRGMEPDLFFFLQGDTLREAADVTMLPFRIGASVASASGVVAMVLGAIGAVRRHRLSRRRKDARVRDPSGAGSPLRHTAPARAGHGSVDRRGRRRRRRRPGSARDACRRTGGQRDRTGGPAGVGKRPPAARRRLHGGLRGTGPTHGEARRAACPAHGLTSPARRMATRHGTKGNGWKTACGEAHRKQPTARALSVAFERYARPSHEAR